MITNLFSLGNILKRFEVKNIGITESAYQRLEKAGFNNFYDIIVNPNDALEAIGTDEAEITDFRNLILDCLRFCGLHPLYYDSYRFPFKESTINKVKEAIRKDESDIRNEMKLEFDSVSANESFAKSTVAAFMAQMNPNEDEVVDVMTAVLAAVNGMITRGYDGKVYKITILGRVEGSQLSLRIDISRPPEFELPDSEFEFYLMEKHMDEVQVISEPGKGTTILMKKQIR